MIGWNIGLQAGINELDARGDEASLAIAEAQARRIPEPHYRACSGELARWDFNRAAHIFQHSRLHRPHRLSSRWNRCPCSQPPVWSNHNHSKMVIGSGNFNEIYSTLQRRRDPRPTVTDAAGTDADRLAALLPVAIGLLFAPEHVRSGALLAAAQRFAGEQEALKQYQQALQERDFQQAELERQAALQQEQADAQARETALRVATGLATDEERRQLTADVSSTASAIQAGHCEDERRYASSQQAHGNREQSVAASRAESGAYQNAASILAQYGYELPTIPAAPSVPEQQQQLREQIEPQQLQLQREKFDFSKWRASQEVQQGWARINQMQQRLQIQAQSLTRAMQNQNWKQAQDALQNIRSYYGQLGKEENNLIKALNASTRDELGRPVPVYNIPLERQSQSPCRQPACITIRGTVARPCPPARRGAPRATAKRRTSSSRWSCLQHKRHRQRKRSRSLKHAVATPSRHR